MTDTGKCIDVTRTVANYAIVLMHAWAAVQYACSGTWEYHVWDFICNSLAAMVLPALFLISGYLMMINFKVASYGAKLGRRVRRLLVPYVAWNAMFVAIYLCAAHYVPRLQTRVDAFGLSSWNGIFAKTVSLMGSPIDMPTWFMRTLIVYAVFSLPLWYLLRHRRCALVYGMLALWYILSLWLGIHGKLMFTYPFYSMLCFVIGAHMSVCAVSPFDVFKSRLWFIVAAVGSAGLCCHNFIWRWTYSPLRDISFILMLPGLFTGAPYLCSLADRVPQWDFFRRSSFFLYTGHFLFCGMVLHSVAPLFNSWNGTGKLTALIAVFCVIGVAVNLCAYLIGRKLLRKMFGVFDGTL